MTNYDAWKTESPEDERLRKNAINHGPTNVRALNDEELARELRLAKLGCALATERDTIRRQNEAQRWYEKLEREMQRRESRR